MSRTLVVCERGTGAIAGFFSLSAGLILRGSAVKPLQRNAPNEIPVMVLGRLAVDQAWAGQGVGTGMLREAVQRGQTISTIAGAAALMTQAKSAAAASFYLKHGFQPSPLDPLLLMVRL